MGTNSQRFSDLLTATRAVLRRTIGIDFGDIETSLFSFVFQSQYEVTPCRVRNAFGKMVILDHIGNLKVLDGNKIVPLVDVEPMCNLAVKFMALIHYLFVKSCKAFSHFRTSVTSFFTLRQAALEFLQFLFRNAQVARIVNLITVRRSEKTIKSNVNPNVSFNFNFGNIGDFDGDIGIPAACIAYDLKVFNLPVWDGSMQLDFDFTEFRDFHSIEARPCITNQVYTQVGVGDRAVTIARLESRVSRLFAFLKTTKERSKGFIESAQGVLKGVNVKRCPKRRFFSQLSEACRLRAVRDAFTVLLIRPFSPIQSLIVERLARLKVFFKRLCLFFRWIDSVFQGREHVVFSSKQDSQLSLVSLSCGSLLRNAVKSLSIQRQFLFLNGFSYTVLYRISSVLQGKKEGAIPHPLKKRGVSLRQIL